jgi:amino-acid N-acetyltransferase
MSSEERERPRRIRVTGLQEAQLPDLAEVERGATAMYYDAGFDGAEVPVRSMADIVSLTRDHEVLVAEADRVVAGYLAWRDEAPGVAYLEEISVGPEHQRVGVGAALLDELCRHAQAIRVRTESGPKAIEHVVARCWRRATWAMAFYARAGFRELGPDAPTEVRAWYDDRAAVGRPVTRPGEVVLWASARRPEPATEDEAEAGDEGA